MIQEVLLWAKTQLMANQFAGGGLMVVAFSSIVYFLRSLPTMLWQRVQRLTLLEVEIRQPDQLYDWLGLWFNNNDYTKRARLLSAVTAYAEDYYEEDENNRRLQVCLIPGIGRHLIRFQGHWLLINRSREGEGNASSASSLDSMFQRETYYILTTRWGRQAVHAFLAEARRVALEKEGCGPDMYLAKHGWWDRTHRMTPRLLSSVHLPHTLGSDLMGCCKTFLGAQAQYLRTGVPWRMGILLHGAPGNGKSSLIAALANELSLDVGYINLSAKHICDNTLLELLAKAGRKLIVLEDIDSVYHGRERKEGSEEISFSGLLNAIDGVVSSEGRILVMTTNHIDKLDAALIRPGRVDHVVEIPYPNKEQLFALYCKFYPDGVAMAEEFANENLGASMAAAQQQLLENDQWAM